MHIRTVFTYLCALQVTLILFCVTGHTQSAGGGNGGDRPSRAPIEVSDAQCQDGDVTYDPAAETGRQYILVCVGGAWITTNSKANIPSTFDPNRCQEGATYYDPAADPNKPKWYECKDGVYKPIKPKGGLLESLFGRG